MLNLLVAVLRKRGRFLVPQAGVAHTELGTHARTEERAETPAGGDFERGHRHVGVDAERKHLTAGGDEHAFAAFRKPARADLERQAPTRCVFTGTIVGDDLATLYASADVFVCLSETETFGNVVVEAQASGLPAVVALRGATSELVLDGSTGIVVDPRDVDAIRRALVRLLRDPELRRRPAAVSGLNPLAGAAIAPGSGPRSLRRRVG